MQNQFRFEYWHCSQLYSIHYYVTSQYNDYYKVKTTFQILDAQFFGQQNCAVP